MSYDPIFQAKVWPVLISMLEAAVSPIFGGRFSYKVPASLSSFPVGVYHSQDGGGSNDDTINHNGWTGLITFRAIDTTLSGAWNKINQTCTALQGLEHPDYSVRVNIQRPIEFPIEKLTIGSIYTAGIVIDMGIYPK